MAILAAGDTSLNYQTMGQGETIVLIHGLGANQAFWFMGIARVLAEHYRVITYDLRGHGRSNMPNSGYALPDMTADLQALLDHIGIDKAHIVGHSFGARVALHHAVTYRDRVKTLTIADTQVTCLQPRVRLGDWPYWETWKSQLREMGHASFPDDDELITFQLLHHFNKLSNQFAHGALNKRRRAPSLKRRDMGARGGKRWDRLITTTSARRDFDDDSQLTPAGLRTLDMPLLAVYGEYSHCLGSCQRLAQLAQRPEVVIVPGAGHFHPAIKPRQFVRILRRFIRHHSAGPGPQRFAPEARHDR